MSNYYLVGSGIASLSAAAYLIRDGGVLGQDIQIFESQKKFGGSLDANGSAETGYICRGTRGFEYTAYVCMQDLFSWIPSLANRNESMDQEIKKFTKKVTIDSKTRLMNNGRKIDANTYGVGTMDLLTLAKIFITPESFLADRAIEDLFSKSFFKSNFWWMFSTLFAFAPWHSAGELKRYMMTFFQNVPDLNTLSSIRACPVNNYESIVMPMVDFLRSQGVVFTTETEVTDIRFNSIKSHQRQAVEILLRTKTGNQSLPVAADDFVFVTLGSIADPKESSSWQLWDKLAKQNADFGDPHLFTSQPEKSTMTTCTITCNDSEIYDKLRELFQQEPDINRITTFIDSPWSLSLVVPKQPWFSDQPKDSYVMWCHGIWPEGLGRYVAKKMQDCTPDEFLFELFSLLGLQDVPRLVAKTICHKTVLPMGHAQFLRRTQSSRPKVVPPGATNFALLGQYVESEGTTYTMEYSIRTAQKAVYQLLGLQKKSPAAIRGYLSLKNQWRAMKTFLR